MAYEIMHPSNPYSSLHYWVVDSRCGSVDFGGISPDWSVRTEYIGVMSFNTLTYLFLANIPQLWFSSVYLLLDKWNHIPVEG
jgi:hypothetical protein